MLSSPTLHLCKVWWPPNPGRRGRTTPLSPPSWFGTPIPDWHGGGGGGDDGDGGSGDCGDGGDGVDVEDDKGNVNDDGHDSEVQRWNIKKSSQKSTTSCKTKLKGILHQFCLMKDPFNLSPSKSVWSPTCFSIAFPSSMASIPWITFIWHHVND